MFKLWPVGEHVCFHDIQQGWVGDGSGTELCRDSDGIRIASSDENPQKNQQNPRVTRA